MNETSSVICQVWRMFPFIFTFGVYADQQWHAQLAILTIFSMPHFKLCILLLRPKGGSGEVKHEGKQV